MGSHNKETYSFAELDRLAGEMLPARALLSTTAMTYGQDHGSQVFYACQTTHYAGTPGLLGTGLLAEGARSTMTCIPAATHSY